MIKILANTFVLLSLCCNFSGLAFCDPPAAKCPDNIEFIKTGTSVYQATNGVSVIVVQGEKNGLFITFPNPDAELNPTFYQEYSVKDLKKKQTFLTLFINYNEQFDELHVGSKIYKLKANVSLRIRGAKTEIILDKYYLTISTSNCSGRTAMLGFLGVNPSIISNNPIITSVLKANDHGQVSVPYDLTPDGVLLNNKTVPAGNIIGLSLENKNPCPDGTVSILLRAYKEFQRLPQNEKASFLRVQLKKEKDIDPHKLVQLKVTEEIGFAFSPSRGFLKFYRAKENKKLCIVEPFELEL